LECFGVDQLGQLGERRPDVAVVLDDGAET
jgi:hypothetical protein